MPILTFHNGLGRFVKPLLNICDLAMFNLIFGLAVVVYSHVSGEDLRMMWLLVNVGYLPVLFRQTGLKQSMRTILMDRVVADSLINVGIHALFFLSLSEIMTVGDVPVAFYAVYYSMLVVLVPAVNLITRYFIKSYRRRGYNYTRVVIIGTNPTSARLMEELQSDAGYGYRFLGFFDDACRDDFKYPERYVGNIDSLTDFIRENKVEQIYYTLNELMGGDMARVVKIADDTVCEFFYVPQVKPVLGRGYELHNIGPMPILAGRRNPLKNPFNRAVKRGVDLLFSTVFLVTLYPLIYIPVAITIKLTSPGPVYFRQKRTGYRGKSFDCLKFRTMHVNKKADSCQATKDDPRKTRFGDFLRRSSLDELPQFINVWRGDMSIVGPRPHMLKHTEDYSKLVNRYMVRHIVKPGITGWAQVNGYRGLTDELWKMERRVEFDVWYIENWTLLLDLKIMARTVINAFQGEKNAF